MATQAFPHPLTAQNVTGYPESALDKGFACKLEELDRIFAFADACGFTDELLHIVIRKYSLSLPSTAFPA
jgi:hypothetical protein